MKNAVGFTKGSDNHPWPNHFRSARNLDGREKWQEPFHNLCDYMGMEIDPPLWIEPHRFPDFIGKPYVSEWKRVKNNEITVLHPKVTSVLNFKDRRLGVYIGHGYRKAFFSSLSESAEYLLYVKYNLNLGYGSPKSVSDLKKKHLGVQSFINNKIGSPTSRDEIIEYNNCEYTPVDLNSQHPLTPEKTGNEPAIYETGWAKESVMNARKEVEQLLKI